MFVMCMRFVMKLVLFVVIFVFQRDGTAHEGLPVGVMAERVGVPEDVPYTPKLLAATFMGSFDKDPADRFPALLDGRDNTLVTERAIAAAVPEEFVTALVSKTLGELPIL